MLAEDRVGSSSFYKIGLAIFVKLNCETCRLVGPVLHHLQIKLATSIFFRKRLPPN